MALYLNTYPMHYFENVQKIANNAKQWYMYVRDEEDWNFAKLYHFEKATKKFALLHSRVAMKHIPHPQNYKMACNMIFKKHGSVQKFDMAHEVKRYRVVVCQWWLLVSHSNMLYLYDMTSGVKIFEQKIAISAMIGMALNMPKTLQFAKKNPLVKRAICFQYATFVNGTLNVYDGTDANGMSFASALVCSCKIPLICSENVLVFPESECVILQSPDEICIVNMKTSSNYKVVFSTLKFAPLRYAYAIIPVAVRTWELRLCTFSNVYRYLIHEEDQQFKVQYLMYIPTKEAGVGTLECSPSGTKFRMASEIVEIDLLEPEEQRYRLGVFTIDMQSDMVACFGDTKVASQYGVICNITNDFSKYKTTALSMENIVHATTVLDHLVFIDRVGVNKTTVHLVK